jgi:hypothetical protein
VKKLELVNIKEDLQRYLRNKHTVISPEFSKVVADATRFIDAVVRNGFEVAFAQSPVHVNVQPDRPFIEVAEALVDHHIRFVRQTDREVARKSLLEAYTYIAGPRYVFEPTKKTQFVRALRRSEPRKFAALVLSLYLYNLICAQTHDAVRRRIPDVKTLKLYLLKVEAMCRDMITDAMKIRAADPDEAWALAVIKNVETQFASSPGYANQITRSFDPNQIQEVISYCPY